MGGQRDKPAWWRRPCETAAAGEVRDGQGESAQAGASNGAGTRGVGSADKARGAVCPDGWTPAS
jgi:hypothetical protein